MWTRILSVILVILVFTLSSGSVDETGFRLVVGAGSLVLYVVFVLENRAGRFGPKSSWLTLGSTGVVAAVLLTGVLSQTVVSLTPVFAIGAVAFAVIMLRRKRRITDNRGG